MPLMNRYSLLLPKAHAIVFAFALPLQFGTALAQEAHPTRAEVKAQTRAAQKAHQLVPPGEGSLPERPFKPQKTRGDRKAETKIARQNGQLLPAGEIEPKAPPFHSEKTRAQRKAETRQAAKAGQLIPAGETLEPGAK